MAQCTRSGRPLQRSTLHCTCNGFVIIRSANVRNMKRSAHRVTRSWARLVILAFASPLLLAAFIVPAALHADVGGEEMRCNGHAELCDRPFDHVVFAATHNSMSSASDGWTWPFQEQGIARQLNDGVRMLLIDSHRWETPRQQASFEAHLAPPERATFEVKENGSVPAHGVLLCHMMCGLGSTPLSSAMADVATFLATHPNEVLSIFFEDYVPPSETAAVFDAAGLTQYTFVHTAGAPWPTLREMIESGHRLFVMSEHEGPPPDWYQPGWDLTQDTSYSVRSVADFDCALDRGTASNPLFLLNNWVTAAIPSPADAAQVNSYSFLVARAQKCQRERGHLPNFIAVNFYKTGDLFSVVDTLNGVGESRGPG